MKNEETIFNEIKKLSPRLTKTRRGLIEALYRSPAPLSVPDILVALEGKGVVVNKTTVYRELERLEKMGHVHGVQFQDRKQYYELTSRGHHHHLICMQCEKVEDVDVNESELLQEEKKVSKQKNFTVLRHSLEFFGLCKKCKI